MKLLNMHFQRDTGYMEEASGFSSFDPENFEGYEGEESYDPDNFNKRKRPVVAARGIVTSQPNKVQASFDIRISGNCIAREFIELFNALQSIAKIGGVIGNGSGSSVWGAVSVNSGFIGNVALGNPVTATVPVLGAFLVRGATATRKAYWSEDGTLIYEVWDGSTNKAIGVSCPQIPYRALVDWTGANSFQVHKMRITFATVAQIGNDITHFHKSWLGLQKSNQVSPSTYKRPDQFQSLIIDVPVSLRIDSEKGMLMAIEPGETMTINFFVSMYTKSVI